MYKGSSYFVTKYPIKYGLIPFQIIFHFTQTCGTVLQPGSSKMGALLMKVPAASEYTVYCKGEENPSVNLWTEKKKTGKKGTVYLS